MTTEEGKAKVEVEEAKTTTTMGEKIICEWFSSFRRFVNAISMNGKTKFPYMHLSLETLPLVLWLFLDNGKH